MVFLNASVAGKRNSRTMNDDNEALLKVLYSRWVRKSLRQQAEAVLSEPGTSIDNLELILRAFCNPSLLRRKEHSVASWLLYHVNWFDDQRGILSDTLTQSVDKALRANKPISLALRWFHRSIMVCLIPSSIVMYVMDAMYSHKGILSWFNILLGSVMLTLFGAILSLPSSIWFDNSKLRRVRSHIEVLGHHGQPACIGALAIAAVHSSLCDVAIPALASVTARLQPQDYGTLPHQAVPALCHALTKAYSPVVLVTLQALTVVGDGRAIRAVEQVATGTLRAEIKEAATQLLPTLHQREEESRSSSQLLRASSATWEGEHTLLRAAHGVPISPSAELLRAATSEQGEESE